MLELRSWLLPREHSFFWHAKRSKTQNRKSPLKRALIFLKLENEKLMTANLRKRTFCTKRKITVRTLIPERFTKKSLAKIINQARVERSRLAWIIRRLKAQCEVESSFPKRLSRK